MGISEITQSFILSGYQFPIYQIASDTCGTKQRNLSARWLHNYCMNTNWIQLLSHISVASAHVCKHHCCTLLVTVYQHNGKLRRKAQIPGQRLNNITTTSNCCYLPLLFLVITVSLNVQLLLLFSCQSLLSFSCSRAFYYIQSCYVWCDQGKCKHAHIFTDTDGLPQTFRKKNIFKPRALLNH
jgi:hypothetical protein